MFRAWARRSVELHRELAALAEVDAWWWVLAGATAALERLPPRTSYVLHDAEPASDTFVGHRTAVPEDPIRDAIARAHAVRAAVRQLDGELPAQPLARLATADDPEGSCVVTLIDDGARGAITLSGSGSTGTAAHAAALLDELLARD